MRFKSGEISKKMVGTAVGSAIAFGMLLVPAINSDGGAKSYAMYYEGRASTKSKSPKPKVTPKPKVCYKYHSKYNCKTGQVFVGNKCVADPCYGAEKLYSIDGVSYCGYGGGCYPVGNMSGFSSVKCQNPRCPFGYHRSSSYGPNSYGGIGFGDCVPNTKVAVACSRMYSEY